MTIRAKLFGGFFCVALLAGVIGFLGVYSAMGIQQEFKDSSNTHARVVGLENRIISEWHDAVFDLDRFVLSARTGAPNLEVESQFEQRVEKMHADLANLNAAAGSKDDADIARWKRSLDSAVQSGEEVFAEIGSGKDAASVAPLLDVVNARTLEAEIALPALIEREVTNFQDAVTHVETETNRAITATVILTVLAVLLAGGLGFAIARNISGPITKLTVATGEMSRGRLGVKVDVKSHDELGRLAGSFNAMSVDLKESTEELRALTDTLEKRVADRTKELARSNAELEQFAYVASHDLQEPLRAVASYAELLEMKYGETMDERAHKYLGHMIGGVDRMRALINDLLDYSRVGTRGKEFLPTSMEDVLAYAAGSLEKALEESGAVLAHGPLPEIDADESQMRQLLQNLLGNAIKFRGETVPEIRVTATLEDGEWLFSVKDNGIGIEEKYAGRVFEIFQRLQSRREYSGTGIGLSICRRIVERHGGKIWVESEPGKGADFRFTLPVKREESV